MDVTLLEIHLPNAEFNAPFAGRRSVEGDEEPAEPAEAEDPSVRLGPVAGLLGLVGLALLARYLRGGEADRSTLDEVEA